MSQDNKKSFVMYQGDGSNNVFSVPMTKGKYGTISVAFVRRGLDQYEYNPDTWGLNGGLFAWDLSGTKVYTDTATPAIGATIYDQYGVDTGDTVTAVGGATITVNTNVYTRDTLHDVDENTVLTWTGDALQIGDYIVIERTTTRTQPFEFQNNQKHIEKSDDNLERQIQEVADKVDNALLVDPTHTIDSNKMNPVEWMKTILRSVDKSVRGFRYLNGWLDYSLDDPNVADADKTWVHLLNTDNIKAIRERSEIVDNETIYWTEYQASDGTWRILANTSEWDRRIQYAVDTADEAKSVADDAKDIAQDASDKVDGFDDRLTQAEQDASDAKDIAQDASDAVSAHITDTDNPHSVTKAQVGLGNVDDTSDADKPISTATQDALDLKADSADLATVATSGSYTDLSDTPTISTTLAGLTGDVSISSPSGGEHLVYDAVAGKWKNTPSAATVSWGGVAGDINNQSDLMALFATKADISVTYTKTEVDNLLAGKADVATTLAGYGITDAYTTTQVDNLLDNKANVNMDNLTSTGKNISNWSSNFTNCITEISQDISVTITNGHLIVNAGSKVYFPNGSDTFDVFTLPSNFDSGDVSSITADYMFCINNSKTGIAGAPVTNAFSGTTAPANPSTGTIWYDTTNNSVKRWNGSAWVGGFSFPVVILSAGAVLNQVFNGLGYIGSTVFALPGVKGLIPNGRNADGSLKNTESITTRVIKSTAVSRTPSWVILNNDSISIWEETDFYYDAESNYIRQTLNNKDIALLFAGKVFLDSNYKITSFNSKQVFHAVDYNDSEYIGHQAMPSNRYVDLTLPAHGGYITMPADGYVVMSIEPGITGVGIGLRNATAGDIGDVVYMGGTGRYIVHTHVSKGDSVQVYHYNSTPNIFRLVYDNGAQ